MLTRIVCCLGLIASCFAHTVAVDDWPFDPLFTRALSTTNEYNFLRSRPIIISLGDTCQPALNLTYNKLRFMAYPFDWLVVRFDDLYDLIKTDFEYCRKREYFVNGYDPQCNHNRPMNIHYPYVQFPHAAWETLFEDFTRRINRFQKALTYGERVRKKIFFIMHSLTFKNYDVVQNTAEKFSTLFAQKFPQLDFTLIVMHHVPNLALNVNHCTFCYLQHDGWTQTSYAEWTTAFNNLGLINPDAYRDTFSENPFQ